MLLTAEVKNSEMAWEKVNSNRKWTSKRVFLMKEQWASNAPSDVDDGSLLFSEKHKAISYIERTLSSHWKDRFQARSITEEDPSGTREFHVQMSVKPHTYMHSLFQNFLGLVFIYLYIYMYVLC